MRLLLSAAVAACSLTPAIAALTIGALAQPAPAPSTPAVEINPAAAVPVASGKRLACISASQAMKGQDQIDQMQLCMAQARIECLKQAIDQKIVGPQRRDFIRSCAE
jgi:hypothetical protein